ncbi:hypothetical protein VI817_010193 [Penicillium citrinum]|nr:hypothetical protein VI817_010193 [Penicillium citrinum]
MDKASNPSSKRRFFLPIREKISSIKRQPSTSSSSPSKDEGSWPKTVPLLPDGQMQALVYHHEINSMVSGKMYCWTYISKGLAKLGQKEVIFTVRRREKTEAAATFPPGPLEWFSILYSLAQNGQIVDEFHQTRFESSPLLDRLDVRLIIYYPPLELQHVPLSIIPRERLQAIPLTASEAQVAQSYGVMRVISHLGSSERYFPVMPWIDRDRRDCVAAWQMKGSLRDQLPMLSFLGVSCVKRNTTISVYIPRNAEPEIAAEVKSSSATTVLSLDCFPYKHSDSGMVWHQGITPSPRAYGTGTSCISLGFIIFCPQQDLDELRLMEDGVSCKDTNSSPNEAWIDHAS